MAATYWLVSVPFDVPAGGSSETSRNACWQTLRRATEETHDLCVNHKLAVPALRVGTLDALLALSDDLGKATQQAEQGTAKVSRQLLELHGTPDEALWARQLIEGMPVERYLTAFQWDEAKHPLRRPLKETVANLQTSLAATEEALKLRLSAYSAVKSSLAALSRKGQGSLAVRDLRGVVPPGALVQSDNLTTLLVVVPRFALQEWAASYHTFAQYVVPRSAQLLSEDQDSALYSVVLFKRVADAFKAAAGEQGYQVREHTAAADGEPSLASEQAALEAALGAKKAELVAWCNTAYGECLSNWVHLVTVRLFVESILRYGLPPSFMPVVIKPHARTLAAPKGLRQLLADTFGRSQVHWKEEEEAAPGGALGEETHPYVSFTLTVL
jgi:V-type H+-transporting ATPase subunit C